MMVVSKALAAGSEPETRPDGRGARALRFAGGPHGGMMVGAQGTSRGK
jgi:hypothetical protein